MSREEPVPSALHFRIEPKDRRVLESMARHERTTVSQLLRKIVADWIRSQQHHKGTHTMKTTILSVIALALVGGAAYAQPFGFNGTTQQFGNQRYFNGTTPNGQGYTGNSQTLGDQTYSHFYSGGSSLNCTASHVGSTTYTNCY